MKLCVDCKHFRPGAYYPGWCTRRVTNRTDLVTGKEVLTGADDARVMRRGLASCGPEGRLFEQKPAPWWKFW